MYHLLTGKSPYEPPYQFVPARQLNPALSYGIEHILNKCVQPEPGDRYQSVPELLNDLNHSYRYDKAYLKAADVRLPPEEKAPEDKPEKPARKREGFFEDMPEIPVDEIFGKEGRS